MSQTLLALGPYKFKCLSPGFSELGQQLRTPWANVAVANRLDALHWTGPQSDQLTIKGAVFPQALGGAEILTGLRRAALAGLPLMLVASGGAVGGLHVIEGINERQTRHNRAMVAGKNDYDIQLKRYQALPIGGLGGLGAALVQWF